MLDIAIFTLWYTEEVLMCKLYNIVITKSI